MRLKDIATIANVSPSTVSLVINNREGVSDEKRRQILKLLDDYGYRPHEQDTKEQPVSSQRNIQFVKYKRHAMLVDGNPGFVNSLIDAVEMECRRQNYTLFMTSCNREQLCTIAETIDSETTAGVLLLGTELSAEDIQWLSNIPVPMVILDTYLPIEDLNCITMNNYDAVFRSVEHLASLGHSQIGFIANRLPSNNCIERRRAFQVALSEQGLAFDPSLVYEVHPTSDGAYQSIYGLLEQGVKFPSALVANNDSIALGTIKALKEFGIRVPEEVSITGFDNIPFSHISEPPLSTMDVSCTEMGIWAVRLLCDHMKYSFSAITKLRISTKLVIRNSTAPYHG